MVKPIATVLTLLLMTTAGCKRESETTQDSTVDFSAPLSITLDNEGRFADGWAWTLTVESDRSASLEIRTFPDVEQRAFTLTPQQVAALRKTLKTERFFDLADEYGQHVPGGSRQTITVVSGNKTKAVKLHFLTNWVHDDPDKLIEPARAVRVWRHTRQWFGDALAVNLARYDQMVLDAVANR